MKKKVIKIVLVLIVIVAIVAVGLSIPSFFDANVDFPNLIVCKNHKDADFNAICDKCTAILPLSEYGEYKKIEKVNADGVKVEIEGNMLLDTTLSLDFMSGENVVEIARKYVKDISDEDVIGGYDIKLLANNLKFQPAFYSDSVNVKISNLKIEDKRNLGLLHIRDDETFEIIPLSNLDVNEIEFKATNFSTYILISFGSYEVEFNGQGNYFKVLDTNSIEIEDDDEIDGGSNFTFSILPEEEYEITNVSLSNANGTISEEVGNGLGKTITISNIVGNLSITVGTQKIPDIVAQPVTKKVNIGEMAIFSVTGNNVSKVVWQYKGENDLKWKNVENTWGNMTLSGQVASLEISNVIYEQSGYQIRALLYSKEDSDKPRISDTALLTVSQEMVENNIAVKGLPNAPIIIPSRASGVWGNTDVTFKMAINGVLEDDQTLQYKLNDGQWINYTGEVTISTEGITMVYGRAINANKPTLISEESNIEIRIDTVKPTVSNLKQVTGALEFKAQDIDSGLSCWAVTNGTSLPSIVGSTMTYVGTELDIWHPVSNTITAVDLKYQGSNLGTLYVYVKDLAGNVSDVKSIAIIRDILAPKGEIEVEGNKIGDITYVKSSTVKLNITVTDDTTKPENIKMKLLNREEFNSLTEESIKNMVWDNIDPTPTFTTTLNLTEGDKMYRIYLLLKDEAGNISIILK